jgi:tetratricopeptide (TPR) repeat protein
MLLGINWLFSTLSNLIQSPLLFLLLVLPVILIGFPVIMFGVPLSTLYWVHLALRQADYATALKRTAQLQRWRGKTAEMLFTEGTIQLFAGQLAQAEARLRDSLIEGQRRGGLFEQSVALENLGCVLMEQRRYDEALPTFESSLKIKPDRGGPYNYLGELYLRQGREPQRALELIDRALHYKRATWFSRFIDRYMLGEMWSNRAWALALLNRERESAEAIVRGLQETDRKFKPALAGLYWRAGQARRFLNDKPAAVDYWQRARQVDPQGLYGQLAAQALHNPDQGES